MGNLVQNQSLDMVLYNFGCEVLSMVGWCFSLKTMDLDNSNFFLKKLSPKRLFHRLILIFLIPLIVTQISTIYFFYERHWDDVGRRLALALGGQISFIIKNKIQIFITLKQNSLESL